MVAVRLNDRIDGNPVLRIAADDVSLCCLAGHRALEQALAEAGFVLEVTRVLDIDEEVEIRQWRVETRQGPRSFQTHLDDWPRTLPNGAILIRDVAAISTGSRRQAPWASAAGSCCGRSLTDLHRTGRGPRPSIDSFLFRRAPPVRRRD